MGAYGLPQGSRRRAGEQLTVRKPWLPNGVIQAMLIRGRTLYIGGEFTALTHRAGRAVPRRNLAALDLVTGRPKSWRADADGVVRAIATDGTTLFIGGDFTRISGGKRSRLAAVDADSGRLKSWNPRVRCAADADVLAVRALAVAETTLYVGGNFGCIQGRYRSNLAAFELAAGRLLPWNPSVETDQTPGGVNAIQVAGSRVYIGGFFDEVGGVERFGAAAIARPTAAVEPWDAALEVDPVTTGPVGVHSLAVADEAVYLGGFFKRAAGKARQNFAAFSTGDGALLPWRADADRPVRALLVLGGALVVGGDFNHIGGSRRSEIAVVDRLNSEVATWPAEVSGPSGRWDHCGLTYFNPCPGVNAIAATQTLLAIGGGFTRVAQVRQRALAIARIPKAKTSAGPGRTSSVPPTRASGSAGRR